MARARLDTIKADSEPFRRMGRNEHNRILNDLIGEEHAHALQTAASARFRVEPHVRDLDRQYRAVVKQARADVALSFPNALDHVNATGLLMRALLEEQLRPAIASESIGDLVRRYERAIEQRDAVGLTAASLIEDRIARGKGLAASEGELPLVKLLTDRVREEQDARVPFDPGLREQIELTIAFGSSAISLAEPPRCGRSTTSSLRTNSSVMPSMPRHPSMSHGSAPRPRPQPQRRPGRPMRITVPGSSTAGWQND
jgi:hypothetical protein